jgi:hydroxymethylglutaryl-CoA reductase
LIAKEYFSTPKPIKLLKNYWNSDEKIQKLHDEFIENTITNFYIPLGVAPNFLINGKYSTHYAIEESSVVAAASKSAKFFHKRWFQSNRYLSTEKIGQVHFMYKPSKLAFFFVATKQKIFTETESITKKICKKRRWNS